MSQSEFKTTLIPKYFPYNQLSFNSVIKNTNYDPIEHPLCLYYHELLKNYLKKLSKKR